MVRAGDLGQEKAAMAEPHAAGRLCAARLGAQRLMPTAYCRQWHHQTSITFFPCLYKHNLVGWQSGGHKPPVPQLMFPSSCGGS